MSRPLDYHKARRLQQVAAPPPRAAKGPTGPQAKLLKQLRARAGEPGGGVVASSTEASREISRLLVVLEQRRQIRERAAVR